MKDTNVAGRYAKALELLTQRHAGSAGPALLEQLDATLADLRSLAELVRPGSRLGELLTHPQVPPEEKRAVLRKALDGRALRSVVVFADLLLRKKRLSLATEITREFDSLVARAKGIQVAQVFSAVALTAAEIERLHAQLERGPGRRVVLSATVDPDLVGGAYVRIGDRIVDRSIRSMLHSVAAQLHEVGV